MNDGGSRKWRKWWGERVVESKGGGREGNDGGREGNDGGGREGNDGGGREGNDGGGREGKGMMEGGGGMGRERWREGGQWEERDGGREEWCGVMKGGGANGCHSPRLVVACVRSCALDTVCGWSSSRAAAFVRGCSFSLVGIHFC